MTEPARHRFYGELARWWPLLSPVEDYAQEAAFFARLLRSAQTPVQNVLELGSGGGSNAAHLKTAFRMTLVDLEPGMVAVSQVLNPELEHHVGDMRTLRLGREFDAVFVHDAIMYMTSIQDLRAAVDTAFLHCRPGGVAVFAPDSISETFAPSTDCGGSDGLDGTAARLLEWTWDPDPHDSLVRTEYAFLLRRPDGSVEVVHETHVNGVFTRDEWRATLDGAGFSVEEVAERTGDAREPRVIFVGHRPPEPPVAERSAPEA